MASASSCTSDDDLPDMVNGKPRLTDRQKKQNHIASEKKRRDAIRAGFDAICDIVPDMKGQGRSEAMVLARTVEYITELDKQKAELKKAWLAAGKPEALFDRIFADEHKKARDHHRINGPFTPRPAADGAHSGQAKTKGG